MSNIHRALEDAVNAGAGLVWVGAVLALGGFVMLLGRDFHSRCKEDRPKRWPGIVAVGLHCGVLGAGIVLAITSGDTAGTDWQTRCLEFQEEFGWDDDITAAADVDDCARECAAAPLVCEAWMGDPDDLAALDDTDTPDPPDDAVTYTDCVAVIDVLGARYNPDHEDDREAAISRCVGSRTQR